MSIRPKYVPLVAELDQKLQEYHSNVRPLLGIEDEQHRAAFVAQLIDSVRRIDYARLISSRDVSPHRAEPRSNMFDPERAAVLHGRAGNFDEAMWLMFLATACGKHLQDSWRLCRDVYGKLGSNRERWDWVNVRASPEGFTEWLSEIETRFRSDSVRRRFGNHRKYSNLRQLGEAVRSYVEWIKASGGHEHLVQTAVIPSEGDRRRAFDYLYRAMRRQVRYFDRLGCFDFLSLIGKFELAPIEAGSTYMSGATGPLSGASLLFGGVNAPRYSRQNLDTWLIELADFLSTGMQVMEDSLCNWQKCPHEIRTFRG